MTILEKANEELQELEVACKNLKEYKGDDKREKLRLIEEVIYENTDLNIMIEKLLPYDRAKFNNKIESLEHEAMAILNNFLNYKKVEYVEFFKHVEKMIKAYEEYKIARTSLRDLFNYYE